MNQSLSLSAIISFSLRARIRIRRRFHEIYKVNYSAANETLCYYITEARLIRDQPRWPHSSNRSSQCYKKQPKYQLATLGQSNGSKNANFEHSSQICCRNNFRHTCVCLEIFGFRDLSCGFKFKQYASASQQNKQYSLCMQDSTHDSTHTLDKIIASQYGHVFVSYELLHGS